MRLEEVILDGFKSYAVKTTIGPFHPLFNAVTGLNGTGKSNILDAICFVMGIKSLGQMRVSKIEELIYKQGQAGVTRASVTLVFSNTDKRRSPIGMAGHSKITISRQIIIGGRERFVMNGHTARLADIHTVFQSVQLNINNPHFLVMQGRITKVINMKPLEVLGLIEEAAGTKMYEIKRNESAKKIATKESRLQEIDSIVAEEIQPALERLRKEQADYAQSLRAAESAVRLERFCRSYEIFRVQSEIEKLEQRAVEENAIRDEKSAELGRLKTALEDLHQRLRSEEDQVGRTDKQNLEALSKARKKAENELTIAKVALEETAKTKTKAEAELKKLRSALTASEKQLVTVIANTETERNAESRQRQLVTTLQDEIKECQRELEELRTGVGSKQKSSDGKAKSFATASESLMEAETKLVRFQTEENQLAIKIQQWRKDAAAMQKQNRDQKQSASVTALTEDVENRKKQVELLKQKAEGMLKGREELAAMQSKRDSLEQKIAALEDRISGCRRKLFSVVRLRQENPDGGQNGIMGLALELFDVKEDQLEYALALEEAGKSRLLQVVVQNDEVAKRLLEKYKTIRRVTCIPMNKIVGRGVPDAKLAKAKSLVGVAPASHAICRPQDIIRPLDPDFEPSLTYVFGSSYLCRTPDLAGMVSQHDAIKGFAVTQQGDSYNPSGSVSGGSQAGMGGLLMAYREFKGLSAQLEESQKEKRDLDALIADSRSALTINEMASRDLQVQSIALDGLMKRLSELKASSVEGKIAQLESDIAGAEERKRVVVECEIPPLKDVEIPRLKRAVESMNDSRPERIQKLEKTLKDLKPKHRKEQLALDRLVQGMQSIHSDTTVLTEQIAELKAAIEEKQNEELPQLEETLKINTSALKEKTSLHSRAADAEADAESLCRLKSEICAQLGEQKSATESQIGAVEAELAKVGHSLRSIRQSLQDLNKRKSGLLRDFPWLSEELERIIRDPQARKEFTAPDARFCFERLESANADVEKLKRKTNKNVIATLERAEKDHEGLIKKRDQVLRDKTKLEEFIAEVDDKKSRALETCWSQVNDNFSAIFEALLPNSSAALAPLPGTSVKDGLEMRVTLSGVEKSSLSELSGGQRSLLALSLILALLKFKPAPLYILDEIDAALDLSHTQHIGRMIKKHFTDSQFIVVSLKENLFNYADVLFRTAFANGVSVVKRTQNTNVDVKTTTNDGKGEFIRQRSRVLGKENEISDDEEVI